MSQEDKPGEGEGTTQAGADSDQFKAKVKAGAEDEVEGEAEAEAEAEVEGEKPGEGVPPAPELTFEQIQATPAFQQVQGERDRTKNLLRDTETDAAAARQQLAQIRRQRDEDLVVQLGDSQETRDLVTRLRETEEKAANLELREKKVAPLEREALARELGSEYSVDWQDLNSAEVKTGPEMEAVAKALKKERERAGTPQQPGAPAKKPALGHLPDAAVSTAAARSWAQDQDDYIAGNITLEQYRAKALKAGKDLM